MNDTSKGLVIEQDKPIQAVDTSPAGLLAHAMVHGADLEQLEKFMELKDRWEANEARKAFVVALSAFRSECPDIAKTRTGHNCKYAGLAETITSIKPLLAETGLSHRWEVDQSDGGICVTCVLTHVDGHFESTSMKAGADSSGSKNSIQALGSTISYLERYTLYAILGLASMEMDNDGAEEIELITPEQAADLHSMLEDHGMTDGRLLKWYNATIKGNISSISDIKECNYGEVISKIKEASK